jgi:hypothetical protein
MRVSGFRHGIMRSPFPLRLWRCWIRSRCLWKLGGEPSQLPTCAGPPPPLRRWLCWLAAGEASLVGHCCWCYRGGLHAAAAVNPCRDAEERPEGWIPLVVAENKLGNALALERLEAVRGFPPAVMNYSGCVPACLRACLPACLHLNLRACSLLVGWLGACLLSRTPVPDGGTAGQVAKHYLSDIDPAAWPAG